MVLDSTAIKVEQTELDAGDLSAVTKAQAGMYPAAYEQFRQDDDIREWEYKILKAEANAKISGAILHENFSRLTRAIFLRDTKRKLKPLKLWSRWCHEADIPIDKADDEIEKLGDFSQRLLGKFSSYVGEDINKIKYLTNGDWGNSPVQIAKEGEKLFIDGKEIDFTPDEIRLIIEARDDNLRKQEEKAAKERAALEKEHTETKKKLTKAEKELRQIEREANRKGITPEEAGFLKGIDEIKMRYTEAVKDFYKLALDEDEPLTETMSAARKTTLEYMRLLLDGEA
ncbi:MAG TPA: hypothetical protein PLV37_07715 [Bacillota bacterium]|nr:hypothetical protein [Bacillota bacterium]